MGSRCPTATSRAAHARPELDQQHLPAVLLDTRTTFTGQVSGRKLSLNSRRSDRHVGSTPGAHGHRALLSPREVRKRPQGHLHLLRPKAPGLRTPFQLSPPPMHRKGGCKTEPTSRSASTSHLTVPHSPVARLVAEEPCCLQVLDAAIHDLRGCYSDIGINAIIPILGLFR